MGCNFPLPAYIKRDSIGKVSSVKIFKTEYNGNFDSMNFENSVNATLPCGKCIACRLAYSSMWGVRCYLESTLHRFNYFVTLTYDDKHLPLSELGVATLRKKDMQDFMKRLRRKYDYGKDHIGIRFFGAGEYGERTYRPHYHLLLFNLPIGDLKLYKKSFSGDLYFNSETLSKLWGKGFVVIAELVYESAAYVAQYSMKKNTRKDYIELNGLEPEFLNMSRSPGIARDYFDNHYEDIYSNDEILVPTNGGYRAFPVPDYFDRLYEKIDGSHLLKIKEKRLSYILDNQIKDGMEIAYFNYRKEKSKVRSYSPVRDLDDK